MQKHTNRLIVAAVLIAAGVIGGFFVFAAHRRAAGIDAAADDVTRRVERMIATAGDIAAAQQSAMLLQRFGQDAAAIRPLLQSNDAAATLDEVEKDFKAIVVIDGKARQDLQQAQNLLAADLIFGEGHDTIAALVMTLRGLESSEEQTAAVERASLERQQWGGLVLVALVWVVGLMVLVPMASTVAPANPEPLNLEPSNLEPPNHQVPATVDLAATADVCGALVRTTNTASLRDALARSASVLDARGIIVWMGAGEELFPALWFGYDERIVQRLGPIARNAANATAEAWRTAQLRTVSADVMSHGAVAVPITGVSGCVGVFAAEVRNGREEDPATRAVAAILAAQLAGIVPAWPAGSATEVPKTA
ncbi:MAG: hypothetical protein DMF88_22450 [Acidobacteria bacterium]|nr:MAG: hypothetical protein DMF88_22450 [Acidobacteriota bacterium]